MSDPFHEEKPKSAGGLTPDDFEKCPICKAFVGLAEEAACQILKQVNPNMDVNTCKSVLRMKLQGRPVEEIASRLNVPKDLLLEVISKSAEMAGEALKQKK